jgi:hypothetical protein
MKNCVNLEDVIHKEHLVSACIFSFFVADDELFEHLPLSHSSDAVPVSAPLLLSSSARLTVIPDVDIHRTRPEQ